MFIEMIQRDKNVVQSPASVSVTRHHTAIGRREE